jgi:L-asparaginase/Glu-tRNA(Gln) amidotransferase subunit D
LVALLLLALAYPKAFTQGTKPNVVVLATGGTIALPAARKTPTLEPENPSATG